MENVWLCMFSFDISFMVWLFLRIVLFCGATINLFVVVVIIIIIIIIIINLFGKANYNTIYIYDVSVDLQIKTKK